MASHPVPIPSCSHPTPCQIPTWAAQNKGTEYKLPVSLLLKLYLEQDLWAGEQDLQWSKMWNESLFPEMWEQRAGGNGRDWHWAELSDANVHRIAYYKTYVLTYVLDLYLIFWSLVHLEELRILFCKPYITLSSHMLTTIRIKDQKSQFHPLRKMKEIK